ncbi:MAG: PAS domain S-box protein, partial [Daejeonella sp.]|uniref:PAS domain S-box protein n=1 Tax=Daejeonella sp. TaxID=2805397 RepID=UPI003C72401C
GPIAKVINGLDYATIANISAEVKTRLTEIAGEAGFKSVIVLPIKIDSVLKATFNIYSTEIDFFDDQEVELLKEATADISFALEVFEKSKLRTQAEARLLESEKKLSKAQSLAQLGYWEFNLDDNTFFWSDETFLIWGRTKEDFKPTIQSLITTIHPEDQDFFISEHSSSSAGLINLDIEYRVIMPDQAVKWVNDIGQIVSSEKGVAIKFEGTVQDITARKVAEEELKKTESLYRQIVETAQEGIWLVDCEGKTTFVNNKMCEILEYTEDEVMASELFAFLDEEGRQRATDAIDNEKRGVATHGDFKYITKSGREVWTSISASPFFDAEGNYNGSLAMVSDITEQKALQQLLDKAITLSRIGTYEIDLVKNEIFWSAMTKEIHEVGEDYVPDFATAIEFYKEGSGREAIQAAIKGAVEHQIPYDLELEIVSAKGNHIWVRAIGDTECHDGVCTRLYGSFQDIQKVKTAELEVLKAYEEKNDILESIDDAFFAVDKNWTITYWNNQAEKILKMQREDALNMNLWDLYSDAIGTSMWKNYHEALTDNTARHFEDYYHAMDMWFEVSAYPSSRGLSVFFKDITERKLSESRLNELNESLQRYADELLISNKGLEQFSYIISHNLRSPVANILGLTEILQSGGNDQETSDILLNDIVTNVQRLDDVIRDLNHILSVKSVLNELKEPVSLTALLSTIRTSIKNIIEQENVDFNLSGIQVDEI